VLLVLDAGWREPQWIPGMQAKVVVRPVLAALLVVMLAHGLASAQPGDGRLKTIQETGLVPVDTQTRFQVITDGVADMECGSTTVSLSRMKLDFSSLIYAESTGVLVSTKLGAFGFDGMAGKRLGVIAGSTNARAIRDQLARRKLAATLIEFRDRQEGVAALARREIDGFATDKLVLLALAQAAAMHDYVLLPDDLSFEPFAIVLPRGDYEFRLAVNSALAQVFRSGEVVELYTKYFTGLAQRPSAWLGAIFTFGGLPE
jgi:glutamate/aspartate transport system substrate-binding protein